MLITRAQPLHVDADEANIVQKTVLSGKLPGLGQHRIEKGLAFLTGTILDECDEAGIIG